MTAQGSPVSVLRRALRGGDLTSVDMALIDVPQVDLQDALEIIALMAAAGDPRFGRWAERWAERAAVEERERLTRQLGRLPDDDALKALRERAVELRGLHPAVRLTVRRGPSAAATSESAR